jgi:hypothetical protein
MITQVLHCPNCHGTDILNVWLVIQFVFPKRFLCMTSVIGLFINRYKFGVAALLLYQQVENTSST